jgi:hypothetical protein
VVSECVGDVVFMALSAIPTSRSAYTKPAQNRLVP